MGQTRCSGTNQFFTGTAGKQLANSLQYNLSYIMVGTTLFAADRCSTMKLEKLWNDWLHSSGTYHAVCMDGVILTLHTLYQYTPIKDWCSSALLLHTGILETMKLLTFCTNQSISVPTKLTPRIILIMLSPLLMLKLLINSIKINIKKESFSPNFRFHMISTPKNYWTLTAGSFVCEGILLFY